MISGFTGRLRRNASWPARAAYGALFVLVMLPLYVMAALLAIRAGMFRVTGTPGGAQTSTFLTFIGGGLATAATVLGGLFTWQHNRQERHRLGLQTVIDSLGSLAVGSKPRVAGVLASMVLLGHPRVAMRMLAPAWEAGEVDADTATWLIGQVLAPDQRGTSSTDGDSIDPAAVREAATVLMDHVGDLTKPPPRKFSFPGHFLGSWSADPELPGDVRKQLLLVMGTMLASRDMDWWCPGGFPPNWPTTVLVECAREDPARELRSAAALLISVMYRYFPERFRRSSLFRNDPSALDTILENGQTAGASDKFQEFAQIGKQITRAWGEPVPPC